MNPRQLEVYLVEVIAGAVSGITVTAPSRAGLREVHIYTFSASNGFGIKA